MIPKRTLFARRLPILAALALAAPLAHAQGISFVTRRTPTMEKQTPARRFFDDAGLATAGATANTAASGPRSPALAGIPNPAGATNTPAPALAGRPGSTSPASSTLAAKPGPIRLPPPGAARGFIVPPAAGSASRTVSPAATPAARPPSDRNRIESKVP